MANRQFTGQRVKAIRPRAYRECIALLAEDVPVLRIAKQLNLSPNSVEAIRQHEAKAVEDTKKSLANQLLRITGRAADRVEDTIDKAPVQIAAMVMGISTEKALMLLGEGHSNVPVQVNVQVNAQQLHERYAELKARVESEIKAKTITGTVSEP